MQMISLFISSFSIEQFVPDNEVKNGEMNTTKITVEIVPIIEADGPSETFKDEESKVCQ